MLPNHLRSPLVFAALAALAVPPALVAQAAPASARQLGTVKSINGTSVTLSTSAGAEVTVTIADGASVLQLPAGSTDLKTATPAKLEDVSVGDRILAVGKAGDTAGTLTATRVILMKSSDIAARNAAQQRDWQIHGLGGLVRSVDGSTITIVSGAKIIKIDTTPTTKFERYAQDSVAFADVKPASLTSIQKGDQLRARGKVADDRLSMTADEVVSGSFENLSGTVISINTSAQTLTLKDLATKKTVTVDVGQKSDLRTLPPQAAAAFAARNSGGAAAAPGTAGARPAGAPGSPAAGGATSGGGPVAGGYGAGSGRPRSAGTDLSQMLSRLPTQTLADLKPGQAVMIVASQGGSGNPTAITMLSGVEQILSATPAGQQPITLSPWNIGGGEAVGEGEGGR